jgi:hypothetical protein
MLRKSKWLPIAFFLACAFWGATGCYSPINSQEYFVAAAKGDRVLEPLYSTPLYTVYFDFALKRCVVHSAHTWGQQGGGGGGTGIGIQAFRCDPRLIRQRAQRLGHRVYPSRIRTRYTTSARPGKPRPPAARPRPIAPKPQPAQPQEAPVWENN